MVDPHEFDLHQGRPPRTTANIRAALQSIHENAEVGAHEGTYVDGLGGDYPIAVATFYDPKVANSAQHLLGNAGILSKVVRRGSGASVVVDNDDHVRAAKLLSEHRECFPNRFPKKESRRFDLLIFGFALGMTLGAIIATGVANLREEVAILIAFSGVGALVGHLLDRLRMRHFRTGQFRMGVWELMLLMSIIGLAITTGRLVASIF